MKNTIYIYIMILIIKVGRRGKNKNCSCSHTYVELLSAQFVLFFLHLKSSNRKMGIKDKKIKRTEKLYHAFDLLCIDTVG